MNAPTSNIIHRLKREILPLEGLKVLPSDLKIDLGIPSLEDAFPNKTFPVGVVHEFVSDAFGNAAATSGFLAFLLSKLMQRDGIAMWVSCGRSIFAGALKRYGITPENIIFAHPKNARDALWIVEEALRCERFAAVVGEVSQITFTESRRLQLASEKSRVTGLIHRQDPRFQNTVSFISRWEISALPSHMEDSLPGVGFPRWQIDLKKIRNGRPGKWVVEWTPQGLHDPQENFLLARDLYQTKAG